MIKTTDRNYKALKGVNTALKLLRKKVMIMGLEPLSTCYLVDQKEVFR